MRKVKRYSKIIITCISLICVLAVSALSTYARSDEPYYDNTFQMLQQSNTRSTMMIAKYKWYQSGWFTVKDYVFNQNEFFRMVGYNVPAFKDVTAGIDGNHDLTEPEVFSDIGVDKSGVNGLVLEPGDVLSIKFDWYYNIRLSVGVDRNASYSGGFNDLPVTALDPRTALYFSSDKVADSSGNHYWYKIDATSVKNHGIYNKVDSERSTALYWSTVSFQFKNDTKQTLNFKMFRPYYDVRSGFFEPQYADYIISQFGGQVPLASDIVSVDVADTRSYVYMGYKSNVLPSYKITKSANSGNVQTSEDIQNATDSIVGELDGLSSTIEDSFNDLGTQIEDGFSGLSGDISDLDTSINKGLDELGIGIAGGFNDLETSIDKDIKDSTNALKQELGDLDTSINDGLDDLGNQIGKDLDDAVGDADIPDDKYEGNTNTVNGANNQLDSNHQQEQELVDEALGNAENALKQYNLFDLTSVTSGISSLARTFAVITPAFNGFIGSLGGEFNVLLTYCIVGGIVLSICGLAGQVFMSNAKSERAAARQSARMESRRSK